MLYFCAISNDISDSYIPAHSVHIECYVYTSNVVGSYNEILLSYTIYGG